MADPGLHVLQVVQPADGGAPEHVRVLTEGLLRRGHRVEVAGAPDALVRARCEAAGARWHPVDLVGQLHLPHRDLAAGRALAAVLRDTRPDVVHAHGQKAGILARLLARRAGVPAVYTPHGFIYRTQRVRPRPTSGARERIMRGAERRLARRSAAVIAVSAEERDAALRDRIAPPGRLHLVYNGVAVDRAAAPDPALAAFRGAGPLFGLVAGIRDQKGLPTLLDALELLAAQGAAPRFAIVGDGPLREAVELRVRSGGLAATTIVRPFGGRVEPHLAALDAFVLPSYWEGLPIAVVEALAMGLPVIASATGGTAEAILEGETGLLVPPFDAGALAAAIATLAADPVARERMGAAGRELAARRFGLERMLDELEAVYRAAVADG